MVGEFVPEFSYVLWLAAKVVRVALDLGSRGALLKQIVDFPVSREPLIVEPSVAHRGTDNHGTRFERPGITHYRGADGLQHYDRVRSHAGSVVERARHAEHQNVGLVSLHPDLHPLSCRGPTRLLHVSGTTGEHANLPGLTIEGGVNGKEGSTYRLLDLLAHLGELIAEVAVGRGGHEVRAVY